jgi:hypothetical protein
MAEAAADAAMLVLHFQHLEVTVAVDQVKTERSYWELMLLQILAVAEAA